MCSARLLSRVFGVRAYVRPASLMSSVGRGVFRIWGAPASVVGETGRKGVICWVEEMGQCVPGLCGWGWCGGVCDMGSTVGWRVWESVVVSCGLWYRW
jgi:hypothetical protein